MAEKNVANTMTDAIKVYKAMFFDLPVAGMRQSMGFANDADTTANAWSSYDALVRMTSRNIDNLYRTPQFAAATARSLEGLLSWQQVNNAFTRTMLTGLTQAAGLPSAKDTKVLQKEIRALRDEVTALRGASELQTVKSTRKKPAPAVKRAAA